MSDEFSETELINSYPIFADYLYVADGKVYRSDHHGITVRELKLREGFKSVKNCDIAGRKLWGKP